MKNILLIALVLLFSACSDVFDSISSPSTPKINNTVPTVNYSSIKSISDITSKQIKINGFIHKKIPKN
jgi:hypothetical protein